MSLTPGEAFQIAQRYREGRLIGIQPKPLRKPPALDPNQYVPMFFLWMCYGRGMCEINFAQFVYADETIRRIGGRGESRRYHVGSFEVAWQKRNRGRRSVNASH